MVELSKVFPQIAIALGIVAAALLLVRVIMQTVERLRGNGTRSSGSSSWSSRRSTAPRGPPGNPPPVPSSSGQGSELGAKLDAQGSRLDAQGARLDAMAVQLDEHRDKLDALGRGQREILEHLTTAKA